MADRAPSLRIQLRRAKGWRMPANTVKCDRSTPLGNPFVVGIDGPQAECVQLYRHLISGWLCVADATMEAQRAARRYLVGHAAELMGKNLACWCRLCARHKEGKPLLEPCPDCAPCHVDVIAEAVALLTRPEAANA